jgi:hypothetical protein
VDDPYSVSLPLRKFLTLTACPPGWKAFDLYLLCDENTAFYAGQSYCAFERVWDHIKAGPHGHSIVGRFVLVNWPRSGSFTVELVSSRGPRFAGVGHDLDAAERQLIEELRPCFNVALNQQPVPLPPGCLPPNAPIKYLRSFKRMLREAGYAARRQNDPGTWDM